MEQNTSTKMPRHIWTVLCTESAIDKDSNTLSLFHVLEQVRVNQSQVDAAKQQHGSDAVTMPFGMELVSFWDREDIEPRDLSAKLVLLDPADQKILEEENSLHFEADKRRLRFRIKMNALKLTANGVYQFKLGVKETHGTVYRTVATLPLEVQFVENGQ